VPVINSYHAQKGLGLLPVLTSLAMNTRHNNPIVSQRTCPWEGEIAEQLSNCVAKRTWPWEDHPSFIIYVYIYIYSDLKILIHQYNALKCAHIHS
jgi:hypothetical protein